MECADDFASLNGIELNVEPQAQHVEPQAQQPVEKGRARLLLSRWSVKSPDLVTAPES